MVKRHVKMVSDIRGGHTGWYGIVNGGNGEADRERKLVVFPSLLFSFGFLFCFML